MAITRTEIIDEEDRSLMFFRHFREHFTLAEQLVFKWLDDHCKAYHGGYWLIYSLSNGGVYMAPERNDDLTICLDEKGNVDVTADQAGILACIAGFDQLATETGKTEFTRFSKLIREYSKNKNEVING